MARQSDGTKMQPLFTEAGAPELAADYNLVSNYAAKVGNRRVGTAAERTSASGSDLWTGLEWYETDTKSIYVYATGSWWLTSRPWTAWTPVYTGMTLGTGGVVNYSWYKVSWGLCEIRMHFTFGTSPSATDVSFTGANLPFARASWLVDMENVGVAHWSDVSAGDRRVAFMMSSTSAIRVMYPNWSASGQFYPGTPITLASGDKLNVSITYPVETG